MVSENKVSINEAEQKIIDYIRQNSSITIKELVAESGYSDGYVRKILNSLKEKKVIERQGGNKTGKWILIGS
jgi:predicted HTH transcriptional regulator